MSEPKPVLKKDFDTVVNSESTAAAGTSAAEPLYTALPATVDFDDKMRKALEAPLATRTAIPAMQDLRGTRPRSAFALRNDFGGRFEVLNELGHGGMGVVYRARDLQLSAVLRRAQLRLRGLHFRERDERTATKERLRRIDACWSAAIGTTMVDTVLAADFETRHLLLALSAGEPERIAKALTLEAIQVGFAGRRYWSKSTSILPMAEQLAERLAKPHVTSGLFLARASLAYYLGRWRQSLDLSDQAEAMLRERCTGVAGQIDAARVIAIYSLHLQGRLAEVAARVSVIRKEAVDRGDLLALSFMGMLPEPFLLLAADDPSEARSQLESLLRRFSPERFHVYHMTALSTLTSISLMPVTLNRRAVDSASWVMASRRRCSTASNCIESLMLMSAPVSHSPRLVKTVDPSRKSSPSSAPRDDLRARTYRGLLLWQACSAPASPPGVAVRQHPWASCKPPSTGWRPSTCACTLWRRAVGWVKCWEGTRDDSSLRRPMIGWPANRSVTRNAWRRCLPSVSSIDSTRGCIR